MKPLNLVMTVALAVGLSDVAKAETSGNGLQLNGLQLNGLQLNGLQLNGAYLNGKTFNGTAWNALARNGRGLNGLAIAPPPNPLAALAVRGLAK